MRASIDNFSFEKSLTQFFGMNAAYYRKHFPDMWAHNGIDIRGEYGQPIYATHEGYVQSMSVDDVNHTKGDGIYVRSNDNSYYTVYWHLSKFNDIYPGKQVKEGEVIGFMGNSGFVNPKPTPQCPTCGTHLHFAIRVSAQSKNEYGGFIEPVPWLFRLGDRLPFRLTYNLYYTSRDNSASF
jgi:murein DD-endopeptidase MepM/ murein hydrolase activator NlpD